MGLTPAVMNFSEFRPYMIDEFKVWGDFIKQNDIHPLN